MLGNTATGKIHRISFVGQSPVTESDGRVSFFEHHKYEEFVYPKGGYPAEKGENSIVGKVLNTDGSWAHFEESDSFFADEHGAEALIYDEVNHATHKIRFNKGSLILDAAKGIVTFTKSNVVDKVITPVAEIGELL